MVQARRAALTALALVGAGCASSAERGGLPDGGAADAAAMAADSAPDAGAAADLAAEGGPVDGAGVTSLGLTVDRAELDFGVFHLGCPRASAVARVINRAASLSDPLLVTTDKPFGIGTDRCSGVQLEPGGTCDVEIHVTPEEPGALAGLLQIWSTAVDLVEVRLKVTVEDVVPAFQVSPSVLEFDPVAVGQSMIRRVTVSVPAGFRAVPEVSASISGTDFKVREDGCLGALLKGGQMCEMEIAFQPTGVGLRTAALTLSAAAPCPPFQSQVPLKGIGQ